MSVASHHFNACRALLQMPSRESDLWMRLCHRHRNALLMMADLPLIWRFRRWDSFTQRERMKILDAAHEAGRWVDRLQGPV